MMDGQGVRALMARDPIKGGVEHKVAALPGRQRVLKDYNTSASGAAEFVVSARPTESLFDYLTDHLLANRLFGVNVRLEGFYEADGALHIITSQPLFNGKHGSMDAIAAEMGRMGFEQDPITPSTFRVDSEEAGRFMVTEAHEDNVIFGTSGFAHPIDVHFGFLDRDARIQALKALGLWGGD